MHRALLAALFLCITLQAEDWPQFRGENGTGVSSSKKLPQDFSAEKNIAWKAKIGDGIGSPIVKNGCVFTTAMLADQKLGLFSFDASSGKQLWRSEFDTGTLPRITPPNSHASSTPSTDGERVYVYFSTIGLLAFDFTTGKEVWRHTMTRPAYLMDWGAASSPIVYNDTVIFCQDDDLAPFVVAVDAKTGKEKWKTLRKEMLAGYALPVLCEANGRTDLVIAGSGKLKGYDPATGAELWTCNTLLRTIMTSPVVHDGVIYVAVQSYGDSTRTLKHALLEWLDTNQDKILSREETPKEFHERFDTSDKNKTASLIPTKSTPPSNPLTTWPQVATSFRPSKAAALAMSPRPTSSGTLIPRPPQTSLHPSSSTTASTSSKAAACPAATMRRTAQPSGTAAASAISATTSPHPSRQMAKCTSPPRTASLSNSKTHRSSKSSPSTTWAKK